MYIQCTVHVQGTHTCAHNIHDIVFMYIHVHCMYMYKCTMYMLICIIITCTCMFACYILKPPNLLASFWGSCFQKVS